MNYSQQEIKKKQKNIVSTSRKTKYRVEEWLAYCCVVAAITLLLLFIFGMAGAVRAVVDSAPSVDELDILAKGEESRIYDSEGNVIAALDAEDLSQEYAAADRIPECVKMAFVAMEDKRFFEHHGVDMLGLIQSVYSGVTGQQQEESTENKTITQQLIQNQILDANDNDTFLERFTKEIQEQRLAIELEDSLDKQKILEYYLNTINMGQNIMGVQAAAKQYFDKDISEINLSEAAVLAAMASDASQYNPVLAQESNAQRRQLVLKNMLEESYISEDEYEDALGDDVYLRIQNTNSSKQTKQETSYYSDAVAAQVIDDLKDKLGYSQTEAYNALYGGGLRIYTCQSPSLQKICDEVINTQSYYPKSAKNAQVSFVLIEQATGEVKAVVGGRGKKSGAAGNNRATEVKRQPGSVLAMLSTYAPALDTAGITLGDVEDDTSYFYPGTSTLVKQWQDGSYPGLITLREAITGARNVPAVKTLKKVSVQTGYEFLKKFSLSTLVEQKKSDDGTIYTDLQLQLALGELNEGVTNLELTAAYAAIANEGVYQEPRFYTKLVDKNGNVLLENSETKKHILKESTAWLLTDAMEGVVQEGAGKAGQFTEIKTQLAGNAGHTEKNTDFWFEGYTPYYTAGIWSGDDEGKSQVSSDYHILLWKEIMERIHKEEDKTDGSFQKPSGIVSRWICSKCGNLAVDGLCNEAEGGSALIREAFAEGTEPEKNCDCHVKYAFCKESKKLAAEDCPKVYYRVLLQKTETSQTEDFKNTVEQNITEDTCDVHRSKDE